MCNPFSVCHDLRAATLALAMLCTACAPYQPDPRDPASMLRKLQARTLEDPGIRAAVSHALGREVPPWNLTALQEAALRWSAQLDAAKAKSDEAMQAARHAGQGPIPSLNFPLEYTTNPKPDESPYTIGTGLNLPVEMGHKRQARQAQADHLAAAAAWDVRAAERAVRARVREQLLDHWSAARQTAILEEELDEQEKLLTLVEHRFEQGEIRSQDVDRVRADLAQSRRRALDAQRQSKESFAAAATTIGLTAGALSSAHPQLEAFSAVRDFEFPTIDAASLAERAEVQAALARYEASQAALQLAVANQYPDIHIGPGYTFDAGAHKIVLSLTELPLVLLRDNRALIAEAVARRREAGAELQKTVGEAFGSAEQAIASLRAAARGAEAAQARLASQRRLFGAARRRFDAGEINRVELLHVSLQLNEARLSRETARLQVQKAIGAVEQALPGKERK